MLVSIVIPTLNEEISIGHCIVKAQKTLDALGLSYEIIISDSHSTDSTIAIAKKLGARVVHQQLRGYGNAYHLGIREAQGEIIIIGDADNTYDFSDIEKFIIPLLEKQYDLVIGNRLNSTMGKGAMPWLHRYIGTPIMTLAINILFQTKIKDSNCGMRAFTKKSYALLNLQSPSWEYASEMLIKAAQNKLRILNVDITLHRNMPGRTPHLNPWLAAITNFYLILKLFWKN